MYRSFLIVLMTLLFASVAGATPVFIQDADLTLDASAALKANPASFEMSAVALAEQFAVDHLGGSGAETFAVKASQVDGRLGSTHVRMQQSLFGLPVIGAELLMHADGETGRTYLVNGDFAKAEGAAHPFEARRAGFSKAAIQSIGKNPRVLEGAELVYVLHKGQAVLSWKVRVHYETSDFFQDSDFFFNALNGEKITEHARVHTAKDIATYDANNVNYTSPQMPGTLICTENQNNCNDTAGQAAHDGASDVYDYYATKFGRDSLNDNGMQLVSSVHVLTNWNNAAWYNNQMIYGDGDGSTFIPLSQDLDVVAHELTHGVTDFSSDLLYQNESGALNEGMSDIFGAAVEAWVEGGVGPDTWKLGEDIYTPGTNGDALRYMNNPTQDGYSADYYPERLYQNCSPNSNNDYCGVHGNSGIANLAFQLLTDGGTHPRGKTAVQVPGLGINVTEQIFYRANNTYLSANSNFEAARNATSQAAIDLYGANSSEEAAVQLAWDAVGVPGGSGGGGGGGGGGTCPAGHTEYTSTISAGGSDQVTATFQASGSFHGLLICSGADLDLYLDQVRNNGSTRVRASSTSSGCNEEINYSSNRTRNYQWRVSAYSGSASFTLCVDPG